MMKPFTAAACFTALLASESPSGLFATGFQWFSSWFESTGTASVDEDCLDCRIPERNYREALQIIQTIEQKYPPEQWFYIGVGRSPTLIVAGLQSMHGDDSAMNLPYSGSIYKGSAEQHEVLTVHIPRFLSAAPKDKKWLLIDYVSQCRGLCSLVDWLRMYSQSHPGAFPELNYFAMSEDFYFARQNLVQMGLAHSGTFKATEKSTLFDLRTLSSTGGSNEEKNESEEDDSFIYALHSHGYDSCAEYGSFKSYKLSLNTYSQIDFIDTERRAKFESLKQQWLLFIDKEKY